MLFSKSDLQQTGAKWPIGVGSVVDLNYSFEVSNSVWVDDFTFTGKSSFLNEALFNLAFTNWNRILSEVQFSENDSSPDVVVFATDFIDSTTLGSSNRIESGENILDAEIAIDISLDGGSTNAYLAYTTVLHEIGHTLGLSHPNSDPYDSNYDSNITLMSYNVPDGRYAFTPMALDLPLKVVPVLELVSGRG